MFDSSAHPEERALMIAFQALVRQLTRHAGLDPVPLVAELEAQAASLEEADQRGRHEVGDVAKALREIAGSLR